MKKTLIALTAAMFVVAPLSSTIANAQAVKAYEPQKPLFFLKKHSEKFALSLDAKKNETKKKLFKYNGPKNAFFINGIN